MRKRCVRLLAIASFWVPLLSSTAGAVNIEMSVTLDGVPGSCTGIATGICNVEVASADLMDTLTVTWDLSQRESFNGYQMNVSWDVNQLTLMSSSQLFADSAGPANTFPFVQAPDASQEIAFAEGVDGAGTRVSRVVKTPGSSVGLFALNFQITGEVGTDTEVDVTWRAQGSGLSPASLILDNPMGADLVLVPEPAMPFVSGVALLTLLCLRARGSLGHRLVRNFRGA